MKIGRPLFFIENSQINPTHFLVFIFSAVERMEMGAKNSLYNISVLDILDRSFSICIGRIEIFFTIFLILNITNAFLMYAANLLMPSFNPPYDSIDKLLTWLINYGVSATTIFSLFLLASWIVTSVGNSIVAKYTLDILENKKASLKEHVTSILTSKLLLRILAVGFITGALIILGFILLVLPGVLIMIIFSLAIPALMHERLSVFNSLRRSKELTDNRWWKIFLLHSAIFIILAVTYFLTETLLISFYQIYQQILVRDIIRIIVISLFEPIYPISVTQLYHHLIGWKAARVKETEIKFCHYCGQLLPYDAVYCPNCGRKLD